MTRPHNMRLCDVEAYARQIESDLAAARAEIDALKIAIDTHTHK